jgi:hypothetical protein
MAFAIWWVVFLVPAVGLAIAWRKLLRDSAGDTRSIAGVVCLTFTSAATALALWALARVQFVTPFASRDYTVESLGTFLSLAGVIAGCFIRKPFRGAFFGLAVGASAWMLIVFFLMSSTV